MRAVRSCLLLLSLVSLAPPARAGNVCQDMSSRVGFVLCRFGGRLSSGSGFPVADARTFVTNHHVVHDEGTGRPCDSIEVLFSPTHKVSATIVRADKKLDLAVLRLSADGPAPLPLYVGDGPVLRGTAIRVVGFPGAARRVSSVAMDQYDEPTCTPGIVSAAKHDFSARAVFEHSADTNPGNSGGPVFDMCGSVIGVATYVPKFLPTRDERPSVGLNYAVSAIELQEKILAPASITATTAGDVCATSEAGLDPTVLALLIGGGALLFGGLLTTLILALVRRENGDRVARKRRTNVGDPLAGPPAASTGRPRLEATAGPHQGNTYPLQLDAEISIGRDPDVCSIVLPEGTVAVSRQHAIVYTGPDGRVQVQDNNSSAGTKLGGRRLGLCEWREMGPSDELVLGSGAVRYRLER